jgi:hypothetical protein
LPFFRPVALLCGSKKPSSGQILNFRLNLTTQDEFIIREILAGIAVFALANELHYISPNKHLFNP